MDVRIFGHFVVELCDVGCSAELLNLHAMHTIQWCFYTCNYLSIYLSSCLSIYSCICRYFYICTDGKTQACVCIDWRTEGWRDGWMHSCMYVWCMCDVRVCTCLCICICAWSMLASYIHTYTHTQTNNAQTHTHTHVCTRAYTQTLRHTDRQRQTAGRTDRQTETYMKRRTYILSYTPVYTHVHVCFPWINVSVCV